MALTYEPRIEGMTSNQQEQNARWTERQSGIAIGLAIGAGIIALGEWARKHGAPVVEREYWTKLVGALVYNCFCPGCGAYIKARTAGVDEGTDMEWCGACRWG